MEIIQNHRSNQHNNMIGSFVSGAIALWFFCGRGRDAIFGYAGISYRFVLRIIHVLCLPDSVPERVTNKTSLPVSGT